jgi:hypothetical protein
MRRVTISVLGPDDGEALDLVDLLMSDASLEDTPHQGEVTKSGSAQNPPEQPRGVRAPCNLRPT